MKTPPSSLSKKQFPRNRLRFCMVTCLFLFGISSGATSVKGAVIDGTILTNPTSTNDLWAYSYLDSDPNIYGSSFYHTQLAQFSSAVYQGYVTGTEGQWLTVDSFGLASTEDFQTTHVFETFITSDVSQTVIISASGDDGHSIFVDNAFLAGGGYAVTATGTLEMTANTPYLLTFVGANYAGGRAFWLSMKGGFDPESETYAWSGSVSDAQDISMNAVPEPSSTALLGLGGLALILRRRR
jgi:hypothetical protein